MQAKAHWKAGWQLITLQFTTRTTVAANNVTISSSSAIVATLKFTVAEIIIEEPSLSEGRGPPEDLILW